MTFSSGATVLGTARLTGGQAQWTTWTLNVGSNPITVAYSGDAAFLGSSSPQTTVNVLGVAPVGHQDPIQPIYDGWETPSGTETPSNGATATSSPPEASTDGTMSLLAGKDGTIVAANYANALLGLQQQAGAMTWNLPAGGTTTAPALLIGDTTGDNIISAPNSCTIEGCNDLSVVLNNYADSQIQSGETGAWSQVSPTSLTTVTNDTLVPFLSDSTLSS